MTFKPPTIEDIEAYVREKNLSVDPSFFLEYFETGNWIDSKNNPVRNWKLKILTWHRMSLERGGSHKCSYGTCKYPGVYIAGKDRDGHPYYRCVRHKPIPKSLPSHFLPKMKIVESAEVNVNNERNKQMAALKRSKQNMNRR